MLKYHVKISLQNGHNTQYTEIDLTSMQKHTLPKVCIDRQQD